jgi:hypothetical protein
MSNLELSHFGQRERKLCDPDEVLNDKALANGLLCGFLGHAAGSSGRLNDMAQASDKADQYQHNQNRCKDVLFRTSGLHGSHPNRNVVFIHFTSGQVKPDACNTVSD